MLVNGDNTIAIRWLETPCDKEPITREWSGYGRVSRQGDTKRGMQQEVEILLHQGWHLTNDTKACENNRLWGGW